MILVDMRNLRWKGSQWLSERQNTSTAVGSELSVFQQSK